MEYVNVFGTFGLGLVGRKDRRETDLWVWRVLTRSHIFLLACILSINKNVLAFIMINQKKDT